jgi:uncharacterized protein YjbI with pentapeptide repeats
MEIRHKQSGALLLDVPRADGARMLRGADLHGARLAGASLHDVDLTGADLRGADLRAADLACADLTRADLQGADLRDAIIDGALLFGADLRGANLRGSELVETGIERAFLRGALYDRTTRWPRLFNPLRSGCIRRHAPAELTPAHPSEGRGDEAVPSGVKEGRNQVGE